MKRLLSNNCSQIAVGLLILIQIMATVFALVATLILVLSAFCLNFFSENESDNLTTLRIVDNNHNTLPENIFERQTNSKMLDFSCNNLTLLLEKNSQESNPFADVASQLEPLDNITRKYFR